MITYHAYGDTPQRTAYEGRVLALRETTDVDYAIVWDDEEGIKQVGYGSWSAPNHAQIDATEETLVKVRAWLYERNYDASLRALRNQNADDARQPWGTRQVRVVRGRKVPIGTEGTIIWFGEGNYGLRVGLKDAEGNTHWTAASNVEVINPEQYERPESELVADAERQAISASHRYDR